MRTFISASVATITILAGAATAGASPIPVATLLGDFNVITDGNFALNGPERSATPRRDRGDAGRRGDLSGESPAQGDFALGLGGQGR